MEFNFNELKKTDVSMYTEKKGRYTYLSWVYAVDQILTKDKNATWVYKPVEFFPDNTAMVYCDVNAFGKTMSMQLAVKDNNHKAIKNPNSVDISNAMMRCLVKCIALFGIGLYLFAGEDIPPGDPSEMLELAFQDNGREGALALYNKMSDEERASCKAVIEKIREMTHGTTK